MATTLYDANGIALDVTTPPEPDYYESTVTLTVGTNGQYQTLNDAFTAITKKYPVYKKGGVAVQIKILSGTTINEQIAVQKADFSYVTIIAEDSYVPVNVDGFTAHGLNTHDLRSPNVGAFIGGENGAGLPCIGCVFKVTQNTNSIAVVGYFANRSSKGVVLASSGFDSFYDGCISNNESSITIRQGISRNMTRWGVHARHNGEVSARSADLTNCGDIGAYADRVANLDAREADCSGCKVCVASYHASQICAAGTHITGGGGGNHTGELVNAQSGGIIDCVGMEISDPDCGTIFSVMYGGIITVAALLDFSNRNNCSLYGVTKNTIPNYKGIIFADGDYTSHKLTIYVTPSNATIVVKRNSNNHLVSPDEGTTNEFTIVDSKYNITVSADGYESSTQQVTLSADQTLTVELSPS